LSNYGLLGLIPFIIGLFFILWQEDTILSITGSLIIGSVILTGFNPILGFLNTASDIILKALLNIKNVLTIATVFEIILLFHILNESGFIYSIKNHHSEKWLTKNRLESLILISTIFLFIDRYFATALIGIFSRPIVKKIRLVNEKHAYILNTVTSSISSIIPFTTITALTIGTISLSFNNLGINFSPLRAYFKSIPLQFYNIFSLFIVITTIALKKDILFMKNIGSNKINDTTLNFGLKSIKRGKNNISISTWGVIGSFIILFGAVIFGYLINFSGVYKLKILNIEYPQIIITSALFLGIIFSIVYSIITKSISYKQFKINKSTISSSIFFTVIYIILAISIENLAKRLNFTPYILDFIRDNNKIGLFLPMLIFILSSIISFLSGSYLFTITTAMPLALRLATINLTDPLIIDDLIFCVIASTISGATFGDINSPFSINFIISTAASNSRVKSHFITQIGYSLIAFFTSIVFGYLLFALNTKPYLSISSGMIIIAIIFYFIDNDKLLKWKFGIKSQR